MALAHGLPFVAVNHLEAHALTATLPGIVSPAVRFPYLLLLLSGGHCQCVAVEGVGRYRRLGTTLDDAVGEAFDKSAKLLGLPWPGGPALERLARAGDPGRVPLPRPLLGRPGCDFSWSGLKTAVAHAVARRPGDAAGGGQGRHRRRLPGLGRRRAGRPRGHALDMLPAATALVVAGGVAANAAVRAALGAVAADAACRWWRRPRALHRQRRDGGLGRDRAAAPRPRRPARPCAAAALAAGGDGGLIRRPFYEAPAKALSGHGLPGSLAAPAEFRGPAEGGAGPV